MQQNDDDYDDIDDDDDEVSLAILRCLAKGGEGELNPGSKQGFALQHQPEEGNVGDLLVTQSRQILSHSLPRRVKNCGSIIIFFFPLPNQADSEWLQLDLVLTVRVSVFVCLYYSCVYHSSFQLTTGFVYHTVDSVMTGRLFNCCLPLQSTYINHAT